MRRVLITRSPHQASELADRLRALHLEPILIPTIEIAPPTTFAPLDAALTHLDRFDWLLFTSANAVEAFHRRLTASQQQSRTSHEIVILSNAKDLLLADSGKPIPGGPFIPRLHRGMSGEAPLLKIAAIGPATARALEAIGLHPCLIPPQAVAESLAAALLPCARQPDGSPTRFLLVRAEAARDHLPDTLRAAAAEVTIAPAYRTVIPAGSIAQLQSLFGNPRTRPDAITFTSSSTATNLQALLEVSGLTLPPDILRISIGPITSQTLRDLNLPPHAEAETPTVAALATAVARALGLRVRTVES